MKQSIKNYMKNIAVAADQAVNAVFLGYPDETLSSRLHRLAILTDKPRRTALVGRRIVNAIFFWQEDHCREAYRHEKQKAHFPGSLK